MNQYSARANARSPHSSRRAASNKEIARQLAPSIKTVKNTLRTSLKKPMPARERN